MLLFYYGTDAGRLQLAVTELIDRYRAKHGTACNLHRVDAGEAAGRDELDRILRYPSFFDDATFVTVRGAFTDPESAKATVALLRQTELDTQTVVLVQAPGTKTELSRAGGPLFRFLTSDASRHKTFDQLSGAKLTAWMQAFCAERGCTLGRHEASLIVSRIGSESWAHLTELAKLCAWQGSGTITAASIELLVTPADQQSNVFALTDALSRRDKRTILAELSGQLAHGADPFYLLSMYAFAIRNMLMVKDVANRGSSPQAIAKVTGLHPFVVTKTLVAARHFEQDQLVATHGWLAEADRATKGGQWDATDALYDFVLSVV